MCNQYMMLNISTRQGQSNTSSGTSAVTLSGRVSAGLHSFYFDIPSFFSFFSRYLVFLVQPAVSAVVTGVSSPKVNPLSIVVVLESNGGLLLFRDHPHAASKHTQLIEIAFSWLVWPWWRLQPLWPRRRHVPWKASPSPLSSGCVSCSTPLPTRLSFQNESERERRPLLCNVGWRQGCRTTLYLVRDGDGRAALSGGKNQQNLGIFQHLMGIFSRNLDMHAPSGASARPTMWPWAPRAWTGGSRCTKTGNCLTHRWPNHEQEYETRHTFTEY